MKCCFWLLAISYLPLAISYSQKPFFTFKKANNHNKNHQNDIPILQFQIIDIKHITKILLINV